jgi:hypothetical protein
LSSRGNYVGFANCHRLSARCYHCRNDSACIVWDMDRPNFQCLVCE